MEMMMAITVKGGFWGDLGTTLTLSRGESALKRRIAQWFNKRQLRGYRELALTLNGAAAGSAALATHKQVKAGEVSGEFTSELGGVRTIETVTDVDANTVAADKSDIDAEILSYPLAPATYPANGDDNPREFPGG